MKIKLRSIGTISALLIVLVIFGIPSIRAIDQTLFHESIKDIIGRLWWHENWESVHPLRVDVDSSWMKVSRPGPLLIAHALGAAGKVDADTLDAAKVTLQSGWAHLEVDIWLDDTGQLRCHHGPHAPSPLQDSDCTFERLLSLLRGTNQWLVLDIKTDFQKTGRRILDVALPAKLEGKLIFQLYRPDDVVSFAKWQEEARLPAPILTAYASHRSLNELLKQAERLQIKAFTFPLERAIALSRRVSSISLMVHPVHDCSSFHQALTAGAVGIYAVSDLSCPYTFSAH